MQGNSVPTSAMMTPQGGSEGRGLCTPSAVQAMQEHLATCEFDAALDVDCSMQVMKGCLQAALQHTSARIHSAAALAGGDR